MITEKKKKVTSTFSVRMLRAVPRRAKISLRSGRNLFMPEISDAYSGKDG